MSNYKFSQIGSDIDGENSFDYSGNTDTSQNRGLSISADGSIIAIAASNNNGGATYAGHVRVYKNNNGSWQQVGNDIDGEGNYDNLGVVSLSDNGGIVAVGATGNDANGNNSGHVRIFKNVDDNWVQVGSDIDGEAAGDVSGCSISISSDGSVVAIGARGNDGGGSETGHVRIFKNVDDNWVQIGSDIDGQQLYDDGGGYHQSGSSVSLSDDGNTLVVGASGWIDYDGYVHGEVRIYENNSGTWQQIGSTIDDISNDDKTGQRTSISGDGTTLAVSSWSSGLVRIYERSGSSWNKTKEFSGSSGFGYSVSLSEDVSVLGIGSLYTDNEKG